MGLRHETRESRVAEKRVKSTSKEKEDRRYDILAIFSILLYAEILRMVLCDCAVRAEGPVESTVSQ